MAIKVILFDLDGTLLPIDTDQFIHTYIKKLSSYIVDYVNPEVFVKQLWASTEKMVRSTEEHLTNQQVFDNDFFPKIGNGEVIIPLVERFYEEEFPKLEEFVSSHGFIPELLQTAKNKGYRLVLATNPLFPRTAILDRIRWTGALPEDFEWITSYEVSHFTKPNPKYFQEIIDHIGVTAKECLMVGNDAQEDLVAQQIGMKTFLVTDQIIDRGTPPFTPDGKGTMRDFYEELLEGKGIFANE